MLMFERAAIYPILHANLFFSPHPFRLCVLCVRRREFDLLRTDRVSIILYIRARFEVCGTMWPAVQIGVMVRISGGGFIHDWKLRPMCACICCGSSVSSGWLIPKERNFRIAIFAEAMIHFDCEHVAYYICVVVVVYNCRTTRTTGTINVHCISAKGYTRQSIREAHRHVLGIPFYQSSRLNRRYNCFDNRQRDVSIQRRSSRMLYYIHSETTMRQTI